MSCSTGHHFSLSDASASCSDDESVQVATRSTAVRRDGEVAERLYSLAAKQKKDREDAEASDSSHAQHDYSTGQRLYQVLLACSRPPHSHSRFVLVSFVLLCSFG